MRLIDADKLCEEFKRRQRAALNWKQQAIMNDNLESEIRADAVLGFLSEVKLTIDNAPTIATDEDIKNFTLYNYPLKPGCDVKKEATAAEAASKQVKEKFFELSEDDRIKAIIFLMRSNNKLLRTVLTDDDKDDSGLLTED